MIDVSLYRARIGMFACVLRFKSSRKRFGKYTRFTNGTDIHLRAFICNVFLLIAVSATYGVLRGHAYLIDTYAVAHGENSSGISYPFVHEITANLTFDNGCWTNVLLSCASYGDTAYNDYGQLYSGYTQRILILSADVETNPGPGNAAPDENTQLILNAIKDAKDGISELRAEVKGVKTDISSLKANVLSMQLKLSKVESMYEDIGKRFQAMEGAFGEMRFEHEVLQNDMSCLSMRDEKQEERLNAIEVQLDITESERLKGKLRIFGLEELEANEHELKSDVVRNVLGVAKDEEFSGNTLLSARRVGKEDENGENPRMVIVEFANPDDKFQLFKYRDALRAKGIRISNDISYIKRQKLKDLRKRGLSGYFKGHKLVTINKPNQDSVQTRVFKRAARPSEKTIRASQETVSHDFDMDAIDDVSSID